MFVMLWNQILDQSCVYNNSYFLPLSVTNTEVPVQDTACTSEDKYRGCSSHKSI